MSRAEDKTNTENEEPGRSAPRRDNAIISRNLPLGAVPSRNRYLSAAEARLNLSKFVISRDRDISWTAIADVFSGEED